MIGNGSSSRSTQQLGTPAAGKLPGLLSGGAGGGDKPPRHPRRIKSVHELDAAGSGSKRPVVPTVPAGGDEWDAFRCSSCESSFISQEDLHCHIRRCHAPRSWRRGKDDAPRPPPSVFEKRLSQGGSSSLTSKKGCSVVSKQEQQQKQQADVAAEPEAPAAVPEAPATPIVDLSFDLNVPVPELEEEKGSSG